MRIERGASQILFGFLPGQTVDLNGGVWRIEKWNEPRPLPIDQATVRRAILDQAGPWSASGRDDGLCEELWKGFDVDVVRVNEVEGVRADPFPPIWRCRGCNRLLRRAKVPCKCGSTSRHQLHYVQFHACGRLDEPPLPRCQAHGEVAMRLPGSAAVRDIPFYCPTCGTSLGRGFPYRNCGCGIQPLRLERNVHRAASVFTPRFVSLVNPPDPATAARLRAAGGAARALEWVVNGMAGNEPLGGPQTATGLIDSLIKSGIPTETAQAMAELAREQGALAEGASPLDGIPAETVENAQEEAFAIASAVAEGRISFTDLRSRSGPPLQTLYETAYPPALESAHVESVDLLPRFPVATLAFGYTRGDSTPGAARLNAFRERGLPRAYGMLQATEGLLFRIDPLTVHAWLRSSGLIEEQKTDARDARLDLLRKVRIPSSLDRTGSAAGEAVLQLLHSFCHRMIRILSGFAGVEREGLSEYVLPHHCAFVIYAASRGFVLGGLQAVFETSLHRFLADVVTRDPRCPLDPGCRAGGAACMACLHLGEASCRLFNRYLSREVLFGANGFLR